MSIYETTGSHHNCYFDELFYDDMADFSETDKLVLVNLLGNIFNTFKDLEMDDEDMAEALYDDFGFDAIASIDYKDWEGLKELVGEDETKELRKLYFDCDDWKETKSVVLLYYQGDFVTIFRD